MLAIYITGISIAHNECKVSEIVGKVQRSAEVKKFWNVDGKNGNLKNGCTYMINRPYDVQASVEVLLCYHLK